jgi:hypothetical protein
LNCMLLFLSMFAYLFLVLQFFNRAGRTFLGLPREAHIVGAFLIMAVSIYLGSSAYRCPVCNQPPWAPMNGGRGVALDPPECPMCGARFK